MSVVILIYNVWDFINKEIKSIQNQNLLILEIILINNFSKEDTLTSFEKILKEISRIKIIRNNRI